MKKNRIKIFTCLRLSFLQVLFFFGFTINDGAAQCSHEEEGFVIINEIGNFGSRIEISEYPFEKHLFNEYIELVVVAGEENSFASVDINGWIIDDNNAASTDVGNEPGHLRFNNLPLLPPGSIILIYNDASPYVGIDKFDDGLPNSKGVYQIAFSSNHLTKFEGIPDHHSSDYGINIPPGGNRPIEWKEYIPLRDFGDAVQIRKPDGTLIHSVSWYDANYHFEFSDANHSNAVSLPGVSGTGSISLLSENWMNSGAYVVANTATPGQGNGSMNDVFIQSQSNGINEPSLINIQCDANIHPPSQAAIPTIQVSNGIHDLRITITQDGTNVAQFDINEYGIFSLPITDPGVYTIQACYELDQCCESCELTIPEITVAELDLCESECQTILNTISGGGGQGGGSSDCGSFFNNSGQILNEANGDLEVCGDEGNQQVIEYVQDGDGIDAINIYDINAENTNIYLTPENAILCDTDNIPIEVHADGTQVVSYAWSTNESSSSIVVTQAGEYTVTIVDDTGCSYERTTEIFDEENLHEYLIAEGYYPLLIDETISVTPIDVQGPILEETAEVVISIDGNVVNVNDEINLFLSGLANHFTNISAKIWDVSDCLPVLSTKGNISDFAKNSTTDKFIDLEILSTKNHPYGNDNLYIKKESIVNSTDASGSGTIFIANLSNSIHTATFQEQLEYFLDKALLTGINLEINPTPSTVGPKDAVIVIDDTKYDIVYHIFTHDILCDAVHLPNTHEALLQYSEENDLHEIETADYNPLIIIDYASFQNTKNLWDNGGINSLEDNRLAAFISLHSMGHCAGFEHWMGYPQPRPNYAGEEPCGFMARGGSLFFPQNAQPGDPITLCGIKSYLKSTVIQDYNTFEKMIEHSIMEQPHIIAGIKGRFGL